MMLSPLQLAHIFLAVGLRTGCATLPVDDALLTTELRRMLRMLLRRWRGTLWAPGGLADMAARVSG